MAIADQIQSYVQRLPSTVQAEVLDFVEYLLSKAERREESEWAALSLALAMDGLEEEDTPDYGSADLKVIFA